MTLDYISILAGGQCPNKCHFCVGQYISDESEPHFADMRVVEMFLEAYREDTDTLSLSGSTSDPLAVKNIE